MRMRLKMKTPLTKSLVKNGILSPLLNLVNDRKQSLVMLHHFKIVAREINSLGGKFRFEWPRYSRGWNLKELQSFIAKFSIPHVDFDGCSLGLKSSKGIPIKKPLRIITPSNRLVHNLHERMCSGGHVHQICAGTEAKRSALYTEGMAD